MSTPYRTCFAPVTKPGARLLREPCGDRAFKNGQCREHYLDAKHAREARLGTERRTHKHSARRDLCVENGVPNSGRQWRRLRKLLARVERGHAA